MKKRSYPVLLISFFTLLYSTGCYNDNAELLYGATVTDCSTTQSKYTADISPIITSKCAIPGCHDANGASNPAGFVFLNYAQLSAKKDRINARVIMERTMPPTGPLSDAEINKIKCWIGNGAPNN
ncbi:MAG: hypothetical protein H7211_11805 [Aquabacterium sp.]|nr:hypothetical protein [Ferruginibacter sp.]